MTNQLFIVIKDTFLSQFKSRGYWMLVLSPLIFAALAGAVIFGITKMQGNTTPNIAVVGNQEVRSVLVQSEKELDIHVSNITNEKKANSALQNEKLDGVLTVNKNEATIITQPKSEQIPKEKITAILGNLSRSQKATQYGLTAQQTADLVQPYNLKSVVKQAEQSTNSGNTESANQLIASAIGIITVIIVMWYTSMIANAIANEKSSRIMEILLAATSARVQYFGKIIGIFALVTTHLLIYVIAGFTAFNFFKESSFVKGLASNLNGVTLSFIIYAVVFILVSVALYLVLTSMIASLINDNAQVQQAIQPISMITMVGYVFSFIMTQMPNNLLIRILSYIPFASQSMMPIRLVTHAEGWPAAISALVIATVTLFLLLWFGQGIYAKNVLSYSDESIMKQLIARFRRNK
ncbi:ABC transporter permease [Leuconostoc suionicum]|uniref:ABC transporter permease n=1 Tax=Leuconostoc suionicum TaxID=1511761 RepID=UPI00233F27BC|nr:ABC transporter permease [Leuconostoc suionicum]MDC2805898.1 ABC transporter permease [Leuconostoc suionicum]MDC2823410.1 ABC transporter permease [Leuconostoc suionicum]